MSYSPHELLNTLKTNFGKATEAEWMQETLHEEGGEALGQAAQRGSGGPIPGNAQGQAGGGSEHLVWCKASLLAAGGSGQAALEGPTQTAL